MTPHGRQKRSHGLHGSWCGVCYEDTHPSVVRARGRRADRAAIAEQLADVEGPREREAMAALAAWDDECRADYPLSPVCGKCGAANDDEAAYCAGCGSCGVGGCCPRNVRRPHWIDPSLTVDDIDGGAP